MYRLLFTLILQRITPEVAHSAAARLTSGLGAVPGVRRLLRRLLSPESSVLAVNALGLNFPSPVGVAAGLDKDLTWFEELGCLGFGFVEVGTVTALAQPGNARPRVHRLVKDRALINSMGFPNNGAAAAAARLRTRTGRTIVAANIGRSRVATDALADYRRSVRELAPLADLIVLNVSSPNTPGLRDMQDLDALAGLVAAVRAELDELGASLPLLVKISPDLSDAEVDGVADLALELGLDGIVAVNTTTTRSGLQSSSGVVDEPGGLSGPPLKIRALEVLRRLHERTRGDIVLVSVGGIETANDAWERILAGATLVQAYTGFVYGGPLWPFRLNKGLLRRARACGVHAIQDLVGTDARNPGAEIRSHGNPCAREAATVGTVSAPRGH